MKDILVLGPYDRFNYGDLLFPYIIEGELKHYYNSIEFYSTTASDLSYCGGKKTKSVIDLYQKDKEQKNLTLIIAGGESLFVSWGTLASFIFYYYKYISYLLRIINKTIGYKTAFLLNNLIGRLLLKGRTKFPFTVSKKDFININSIFYNSVGGAVKEPYKRNFLINKTKQIVKNVDYLSVRDENAFALLKANNVKVNLVPDSAILLSKHYSCDYLRKKISIKPINEKYFFFQVNKNLGLNNLDIIVDQLEKLYFSTGLTPCLCPIGIAYGHEDQIALKLVSENLKTPYYYFDEKITIWDIMYLIANSSLYIGTSLHGVITAMSYKIPYIGLHISKVETYLKTWGIQELHKIIMFKDISNRGKEALTVPIHKLEENFIYQKRIAEESFVLMRS